MTHTIDAPAPEVDESISLRVDINQAKANCHVPETQASLTLEANPDDDKDGKPSTPKRFYEEDQAEVSSSSSDSDDNKLLEEDSDEDPVKKEKEMEEMKQFAIANGFDLVFEKEEEKKKPENEGPMFSEVSFNQKPNFAL